MGCRAIHFRLLNVHHCNLETTKDVLVPIQKEAMLGVQISDTYIRRTGPAAFCLQFFNSEFWK